MKKQIFYFIAFYFIASFLDAWSTILAITKGSIEINPFYKILLDQWVPIFLIVRMFLIPFIVSIIAYKIKKYSWYILFIPLIIWFWASFINLFFI